jgi:hypothetical protein
MSTTNEIWLNTGQQLVALDLDDETSLLPSFQANNRAKPNTIQSDYSPEFSVPATAKNHHLLGQAAASQPAVSSGYVCVPCVLTSGGVETLPLAQLYLKGYEEDRYYLQICGGNRRLIDALGDKKLADLDLSRFDHYWTPANILAALPLAQWQSQGWGYEVYDRGKPVDLQALDPYTLYPSCSGELVLQQILIDAGFTADSLLAEPMFAALNVPAANPYKFPQKYCDDRQLTAGYFYPVVNGKQRYLLHTGEFTDERLNFLFTSQKPYHQPDPTTGVTYTSGLYTADTLGYYDIEASIPTYFGCNERGIFGKVRVKFMLLVNGQHLFDSQGGELGKDEAESDHYIRQTFTPKLGRYLLHPGDTVELTWKGDEITTASISPSDPEWSIGRDLSHTVVLEADNLRLVTDVRLSVTLLAEFPQGGLVRLQDWLPDMKQLDFVKTYMLLGGLTIQTDAYDPHLRLAPGNRLLANIDKAPNWTAKRDAYAQPSRVPERKLAFRFGEYGQVNTLAWQEDATVLTGYGNGTIRVADQVLPTTYELATLPFAATQDSPTVQGLLRILNFEASDITVVPRTYTSVEAKPRLTLRRLNGEVIGQLITVPATDTAAAVLTPFTTTMSYFAGVPVSLDLNATVLTTYWQDLRAMLDQSRYLTEKYRLTPRDIIELDFSVPIWDALLGDYFAVSGISEYNPRRSVEVQLVRLNAAYLPARSASGTGEEFYAGEFWSAEFY